MEFDADGIDKVAGALVFAEIDELGKVDVGVGLTGIVVPLTGIVELGNSVVVGIGSLEVVPFTKIDELGAVDVAVGRPVVKFSSELVTSGVVVALSDDRAIVGVEEALLSGIEELGAIDVENPVVELGKLLTSDVVDDAKDDTGLESTTVEFVPVELSVVDGVKDETGLDSTTVEFGPVELSVVDGAKDDKGLENTADEFGAVELSVVEDASEETGLDSTDVRLEADELDKLLAFDGVDGVKDDTGLDSTTVEFGPVELKDVDADVDDASEETGLDSAVVEFGPVELSGVVEADSDETVVGDVGVDVNEAEIADECPEVVEDTIDEVVPDEVGIEVECDVNDVEFETGTVGIDDSEAVVLETPVEAVPVESVPVVLASEEDRTLVPDVTSEVRELVLGTSEDEIPEEDEYGVVLVLETVDESEPEVPVTVLLNEELGPDVLAETVDESEAEVVIPLFFNEELTPEVVLVD